MIYKNKINDQRCKLSEMEDMIYNFKKIEEQLIMKFQPEKDKVILNDILLNDALKKAKADKEQNKWRQNINNNSDEISEFDQMLEDIQFRQQVIRETFKEVRFVVDPQTSNNTGQLY